MTGERVRDMILQLEMVRAVFGPLHSERELNRMNMGSGFNGHDGCWVNDWSCGPDCVMAEHDGQPERILPRSTRCGPV
jgi:hypothetical protein